MDSVRVSPTQVIARHYEPSHDSETSSVDETDTLDDIDDCEVIGYLLNEEESRLKKKIWESLDGNKQYMQQLAAKQAAAAAARKLYTGTSEEIREAQAIAAAAAPKVANGKKSNKRKRELEAKNAKPAQTADQHFNKKKLSSKINHDALKSLFGDEEPNPGNNCVDDDSNKKGKEIANEDDSNNHNSNHDEDDDEWNYENEQVNGGYLDDFDEEY